MELEKLSAVELGTLVNNREVSALEVIEYFADRIEKRNPSINAFTYTKIEEALEEVEKLSYKLMRGENCGPFAGVPVALKDFLPTKKGWPASHGGVKSYQTIDNVTGTVCKGMENLGCIVVGKTNSPAFGFRATTDNKMYGPTSTPFKVGYNSGGSSGGSCAAVADGLVLLGCVGDGGGSSRIPASWCGVFGFKPSAGVIPSVCRPDAWTATHPYCCGFAATKTIEDAAILFDELRRYNPKDPISIPVKDRPVRAELGESIKYMRVAYTYDFGLFPVPEEEIREMIDKVFKMLASEVRILEPTTFHYDYAKEDMENAWLRGINIDDATNPTVQKLVDEHPEDLPEDLIKWHKIARESTMEDYLEFHKLRTNILDSHLDAMEGYDVLLAPVSGCMPVKNSDNFDTKGPEYINGVKIDPLIGFSYTYLQNMTGFPAASIPLGVSKEGFPVGLQVIARRYDDNLIFRFCSVLEKLNPWSYDIPLNRKID